MICLYPQPRKSFPHFGAVAAALVLNAMRDSIVFFSTPSMAAEKHIAAGKRFRLGGLVQPGSLVRGDNLEKSMSQYLIDQMRTKSNISVLLRSEVIAASIDQELADLRALIESYPLKSSAP